MPQKKTKPPKTVGIFPGVKWFWGALVTLVGLLGSAATFYALEPRLQISPAGMLVEASALSTQFEIKNDGFLDAFISDISCRIGKTSIKSSVFRNLQVNDNTISMLHPDLKVLRGGEKSSLPLNRELYFSGTYSSSGEVDWIVAYQVRILPFLGSFHYSQKFESITNISGNVIWNAVSER